MSDLISRDALKEQIKTEIASVPQPDTNADYYVGVNQGLKLAETIIDNAPTITPQAILNGIVEIISKNGITTVDELLEILKGGAK